MNLAAPAFGPARFVAVRGAASLISFLLTRSVLGQAGCQSRSVHSKRAFNANHSEG
jgi:hypothetical protein